MKALMARMRAMLGKGGCVQLEDLVGEIERTKRSISTKIWWYKWSALIVLACIPLLSAVVSILAAEKDHVNAVKYVSYSLTLLAVLNSIFRPGERFRELCVMGIDLQTLKDHFVTRVQEVGGEVAAPELLKVCEETEKRLVPIERRLISLFLPEAQSSVATGKYEEFEAGPLVGTGRRKHRETAPKHPVKTGKAH